MSATASFKVAVLNYSGNVGKTTLARHLLQPRMGNCPIMSVESINDGDEATNIKGKNFNAVLIEVQASDSVIVDIGSSNIEQVFSKARTMGNVFDEFDYLVVPTVDKPKQQANTTKILADLIALGVDPERIKLVLNQVEDADEVESVFQTVLSAARVAGIAFAVVHENEGYAYLGTRTVQEVAAIDRDFRKEIAAAGTKEAKRDLATMQVFSRLAKGIEKELDAAFQTLFSPA
ncbi:StbB family protein [Variovorax sp. LT1P1]|uniref:StbB family protein n=1 Tax=Variovorax sp. LT1P1 TaxID=3443730 RepID=UPI003F44ADCE